jgi:hypothetical protein
MVDQTHPTLMDLLAEYEAEHAFMRKLVLPQDANHRLTEWHGGYRWFASENVVCLEKARLIRQQQARQATAA